MISKKNIYSQQRNEGGFGEPGKCLDSDTDKFSKMSIFQTIVFLVHWAQAHMIISRPGDWLKNGKVRLGIWYWRITSLWSILLNDMWHNNVVAELHVDIWVRVYRSQNGHLSVQTHYKHFRSVSEHLDHFVSQSPNSHFSVHWVQMRCRHLCWISRPTGAFVCWYQCIIFLVYWVIPVNVYRWLYVGLKLAIF